MEVNFSTTLKTIAGEDMRLDDSTGAKGEDGKAATKPLTLGNAAVEALLMPERDLVAEDHTKRTMLAIRIQNALEADVPGPIEVTPKEVTLITDLAVKRWPMPHISAQMANLMDGRAHFEFASE